jgi:hypothetical protein
MIEKITGSVQNYWIRPCMSMNEDLNKETNTNKDDEDFSALKLYFDRT